jgi:hypothetical protein
MPVRRGRKNLIEFKLKRSASIVKNPHRCGFFYARLFGHPVDVVIGVVGEARRLSNPQRDNPMPPSG